MLMVLVFGALAAIFGCGSSVGPGIGVPRKEDRSYEEKHQAIPLQASRTRLTHAPNTFRTGVLHRLPPSFRSHAGLILWLGPSERGRQEEVNPWNPVKSNKRPSDRPPGQFAGSGGLGDAGQRDSGRHAIMGGVGGRGWGEEYRPGTSWDSLGVGS